MIIFSPGRSGTPYVYHEASVLLVLLSAAIVLSLVSSVVTTAVLGVVFWSLLALNTRIFIMDHQYETKPP